MTRIRVGLIGANAKRGWAGAAHVPAIRAVETLELIAIAARDQASADAAAEAFGTAHAFDDPYAMIRDPRVDLVSVVVRVPEHHDLVMAAIAASKAVYCEWPLGIDVAQAEAMTDAARAADVQTAIGLQGRSSPWLRHLKNVVANGYVGRVLSTTLLASDMFSTGGVDQANAYMLDPGNGANPLTIHGGHLLDALTDVLGEFADLSAVTTTSRPEVTIRETDEVVLSTSPDQIVVGGLLASGAVASIHVRAGHPSDRALLWEIQGDRGFLRVSSPAVYLHWRPLLIEGAQGDGPLQPLGPPPDDAFARLERASGGPSWTLARHYAAFADGLLGGERTVAGFEEAVTRHRLVERIRKSGEAFANHATSLAS